jgi:hypothetical protein
VLLSAGLAIALAATPASGAWQADEKAIALIQRSSSSAVIFRFVADRGSNGFFESDNRHAEVPAAVSSYCERRGKFRPLPQNALGLSRRRYTLVNQPHY